MSKPLCYSWILFFSLSLKKKPKQKTFAVEDAVSFQRYVLQGTTHQLHLCGHAVAIHSYDWLWLQNVWTNREQNTLFGVDGGALWLSVFTLCLMWGEVVNLGNKADYSSLPLQMKVLHKYLKTTNQNCLWNIFLQCLIWELRNGELGFLLAVLAWVWITYPTTAEGWWAKLNNI